MTVEARCRDAAKRLTTFDFVRIYSDDDADGIAAAGVMAAALHRQGIPFHLSLERLDATDYDKLQAHDTVLLMDQGAGELDRLASHDGDVVVLDHHAVDGRAPQVLHANPNLEGESGTDACCTASLALLTALHIDPVNTDLAPVAMAGIIGDRQHVPRLVGTNAQLAQRALAAGSLEARRGLPFPPDQPLHEALTRSVDPFLDGLTGSASNCHTFLEDLGLQPQVPTSGLSKAEKKRLTSALVAYLLERGIEPRLAEELAGTRYTGTLFGRPVSAARLTALFNACAREERAGLGVAIANDDERALREAERLVGRYEEDLLKGLLQLSRNPPEQRENIQHFEAVDPELMGAHCGIGMAYVFDQSKPCFGLKVSDDGRIKVSGRATQRLLDRGLNLADALREAAREAGGNGGGHPIAAGAAFPEGARETFLSRLDEIVGEQMDGA